jgi:hypothetical protein
MRKLFMAGNSERKTLAQCPGKLGVQNNRNFKYAHSSFSHPLPPRQQHTGFCTSFVHLAIHSFFHCYLEEGTKKVYSSFYVLDHCRKYKWVEQEGCIPPTPSHYNHFFGHGMYCRALLCPCVGFLKRCFIRNQVASIAGIPLYTN